MPLSREAVETILAPYFDTIKRCIDSAWQDYRRECSTIHHKTSLRSRASNVHDNMVFNARKFFGDEKKVRLAENKGLFLAIFDEKVMLRFKKLDEDKIARGILTQQWIDFLGQQMNLPTIPEATNIIAGYELNALQTDIKAVYITCPSGWGNAWTLELGTATMAEVVPFAATEQKTAPVEFTLKQIKKAEENNG